MKRSDLLGKVVSLMIVVTSVAPVTSIVNAQNPSSTTWKSSFDMQDCDFASTGANTYFILEPGYRLILGNEKGTASVGYHGYE